MKITLTGLFLIVFITAFAPGVWAAETVVDMHAVSAEGVGTKIGTITMKKTDYGTLIMPELSGLSEGLHGFHVHASGSCDPGEKDGKMTAAMAAGGHFDPQQTKSHKGPYESGHLGDLPALYVDASGAAVHPVLAPRIQPSDIQGHALMIHQGGDNYSDTPQELGGGGARVACGVMQ